MADILDLILGLADVFVDIASAAIKRFRKNRKNGQQEENGQSEKKES